MKLAKKLRDKIVHGDFKGAFWKLKPEPSGIRVLKGVEDDSGEELLQKIMGVMDGTVEVSSVPKTKDVGKFGWLLEAAQSGLFQETIDLNNRAISIVDRLSYDHAMREIDTPTQRE